MAVMGLIFPLSIYDVALWKLGERFAKIGHGTVAIAFGDDLHSSLHCCAHYFTD